MLNKVNSEKYALQMSSWYTLHFENKLSQKQKMEEKYEFLNVKDLHMMNSNIGIHFY